jgi:hypothetical protein
MKRRFIVVHLYEISISGPVAKRRGVLVTAQILCPDRRLVKAGKFPSSNAPYMPAMVLSLRKAILKKV